MRRVAQFFVLHQELDDSTLGTAAEALVTVALGVDDEGAHRLVIVEWAKGFVPHAALLQPVGVVRLILTEALLYYLLDLRRVHQFVNSQFINLRHGCWCL